MPRYYVYNQAINKKDCDDFVNKHKEVEFQEAQIIRVADNEKPQQFSPVVLPRYRQCKTYWIGEKELIVKSIWSYVLEINQCFKLSLDGHQKAQLTKYDKDDFYGWHQDLVAEKNGNGRKLSAILQLSKQEDYEGCELQFFNGNDESEKLPITEQGSLIIFRSTEWHRVTPLIKGSRYSLVFWATGLPLT